MIDNILRWLINLLPAALPLYVVRFDIGPLPTTLLEVYVLVLFIVWLISQWTIDSGREPNSVGQKLKKWRKIQNTTYKIQSTIGKWFWPVIAWLAVTLVAVFGAQDHFGALGHWRAFMLEPVLVFVILMTSLRTSTTTARHASRTERGVAGRPSHYSGMRGLIFGILVITILMSLYAILQFVTGWGIPHPWEVLNERRATGTFGFPNGLSLFIVPFGVVCWMEFVRITNAKYQMPNFCIDFQSIFYLIGAILAGGAVVLAKSMGGIIAFGVGVVLTMFLYKRMRWTAIILTIVGILGAGIVAWQIMGTELNPKTLEDTLASSKKWSSSVRVIIWKESLEIIKDHPLLGTGLRSYQTAVAPYHTATWMEIYPHPHNIFLMLWIEIGLAGLIVFLWLIATWVLIVHRRTLHVARPASTNGTTGTSDLGQWLWLIPLIVILVHGMVDMPYFKNDLAIQFWILAALAGTNYESAPVCHSLDIGEQANYPDTTINYI